ncbi:MAG: hypothetical protein K8S16_12875 [Bacteroidales bacterium]|nr:hypothetical protein [Bacteroidales bacterium]
MEELLPLIIGIVWVLYTLYSRSQKKKLKPSPEPGIEKPHREPSILEQILSGQGISVPKPEVIDLDDPYEEQPIKEFNEEAEEKEPAPFLSSELMDIRKKDNQVSVKFITLIKLIRKKKMKTTWTCPPN